MPSDYDLNRLEKLVLKSIDTYSEISGRVGSVEESVKSLRDDLKEIRNDNKGFMKDISSSLATLAEIQNANETGHKVLHKRIDELSEDLEGLHKITDNIKLNCAGVNHADLSKRLDAMERSLKAVLDSMRFFNWKFKGIPLSFVFTGMLIFVFGTTVYNHYPWLITKILEFIK